MLCAAVCRCVLLCAVVCCCVLLVRKLSHVLLQAYSNCLHSANWRRLLKPELKVLSAILRDHAYTTPAAPDWAPCVPASVRASIPRLGLVSHLAQKDFLDACVLHEKTTEVLSPCALITVLSSLCCCVLRLLLCVTVLAAVLLCATVCSCVLLCAAVCCCRGLCGAFCSCVLLCVLLCAVVCSCVSSLCSHPCAVVSALSSPCFQEAAAARDKALRLQQKQAARRHKREVEEANNPALAVSFAVRAENLQALSMVARRLLDATDLSMLYCGQLLCRVFKQQKVPKLNKLLPRKVELSTLTDDPATVPHSAGEWARLQQCDKATPSFYFNKTVLDATFLCARCCCLRLCAPLCYCVLLCCCLLLCAVVCSCALMCVLVCSCVLLCAPLCCCVLLYAVVCCVLLGAAVCCCVLLCAVVCCCVLAGVC